VSGRIVIVDYGMGNIRSVYQALRHAAPEADVRVTSEAAEVLAADRVVLPGQGAMPDCMRFLRESGLQDAVMKIAETHPLMGVCIGEQMLVDASDESHDATPTPGLGLIAGRCVRFKPEDMQLDDGSRLKVPHMGWNNVVQSPHALWAGVEDGAMFYFVHSFHASVVNPAHAVGHSTYGKPGTPAFTCAIARDNIFATQFHPEKSSAAGLTLYRNFASWQP